MSADLLGLINRAGNPTLEELFARSGNTPPQFFVSLADMMRRGLITVSREPGTSESASPPTDKDTMRLVESIQSGGFETFDRWLNDTEKAATTYVMATSKGLRSLF